MLKTIFTRAAWLFVLISILWLFHDQFYLLKTVSVQNDILNELVVRLKKVETGHRVSF
ncbi:hypothetical protein LCGC14_0394350 [marine sediment metagenome]|uniref:Uncharacterized protein n=1 Tax=marine sediment metagenome TaxID=412755 RepID=A0A0F9SYS6_9ZZZZ